MDTYNHFITQTLLPAAADVLRDYYARYTSGCDIGIEEKPDKSPASQADLKAEEVLRALIQKTYPTHGIWGEELGGHQLDSPFIWVLDPLDGTREFLEKRPEGFGTLIGLLHNGVAVAGGIGVPFDVPVPSYAASSAIACTTPVSMFGEEAAKNIFLGFDVIDKLNCVGFKAVANHTLQAALEKGLALHDIAALIPVLSASGAYIFDLEGNDYTTYVFDLTADTTKKFGIVAAHDRKIIDTLLERVGAC